MPAEPAWIQQAAAIPIKEGQVCLITSSSGKRWVVPKGMMEPGKTAGELALQESWEEAGLVGLLDPEPLGSYIYDKYGGICYVTVFLLRVTAVAADWPERWLRQRLWVSPLQAVQQVADQGLRDLLRCVAERVELSV